MAGTCSYRLLTHQVDLDLPDGSTPARAYLANTAVQDVPCRHRARYAVTPAAGRLVLREDGDRFADAASMDEAARLLDERLRLRVCDYLSRAGWLLLAAGLVTVGDRRCLVVGDDVDRSVLLAALLLDGHRVDGAQVVAVRGGDAVAVPFPLRLGVAVLDRVPELAAVWDRLPVVGTDAPVRVVDPPTLGVEWRVVRAPVDAVAVLDDGGTPAIATVLQARSGPSVLPPGAEVREAAMVMGTGSTHRVPASVEGAALLRGALG
jgi:hypothetical protein